MRLSGEQSITVAAPADAVWRMVSDVTRMGAWSPETFRAEWKAGSVPGVGARFQGCNRLTLVGTWCTPCTVTTWEIGRSFGFVVGKDPSRPNTRWEYAFEPLGQRSCKVTERYEMIREPWIVLVYYRLIDRRRQLKRGVARTLSRLREVAEAGLSPPPGTQGGH